MRSKLTIAFAILTLTFLLIGCGSTEEIAPLESPVIETELPTNQTDETNSDSQENNDSASDESSETDTPVGGGETDADQQVQIVNDVESAESQPTTDSNQQATTHPQTDNADQTVENAADNNAATTGAVDSTANQQSEPEETEQTLPPNDWAGIEHWLVSSWNEGLDPSAVRSYLVSANWLASSSEDGATAFRAVDMSGDTKPEWIVTLAAPDSAEISTPRGPRRPTNVIMIGHEGILYRYLRAPEDLVTEAGGEFPRLVDTGDYTGDGIDDAIIEAVTCGVNQCFGLYEFMSYAPGYLDDIAKGVVSGLVLPHPALSTDLQHHTGLVFSVEHFVGSGLSGYRQTDTYIYQNGSMFLADTKSDFAAVPTDEAGLKVWLARARTSGQTAQEVSQHLFDAGWFIGLNEVIEVDLNADGVSEWLVTVTNTNQPVETFHGTGFAGNFFVVGPNGIEYEALNPDAKLPMNIANVGSLGVVDMTGDGVADVPVGMLSCPRADTCTGTYQLISGQNGIITNLIPPSHELSNFTKTQPVASINVDGAHSLPTLDISLNTLASPEGEIWGWDGSAVVKLGDLSAEIIAPQTIPALFDWLPTAFNSNWTDDDVVGALITAGWQDDSADFTSLDIVGDAANEWILTIRNLDSQLGINQREGDLWIVNTQGVIYRASDDIQFLSDFGSAPVVISTNDISNDGRAELTTESLFCGAHTCYSTYTVLGAPNGFFESLLVYEDSDVFNIASAEFEFLGAGAGQPSSFSISGGGIGSAGAGFVRTASYLFEWSEITGKVVLGSVRLHETNWRHHYLYEANDLLASLQPEDWNRARALYQEVIENDSFDDPFSFATGDSAKGDLQQFAAFRLAFTSLQVPRTEGANTWATWLETNFPDTPLTIATRFMTDDFINNTGSAGISCQNAVVHLQTLGLTEPTGSLIDLGYANPSLNIDSLCP